MQTQTFQVQIEHGIHLRVAAEIAKVARTFDAEIALAHGGISADAKSLISLMLLSAVKGSDIIVQASGADERAAVDAIQTVLRYLAHPDATPESPSTADPVPVPAPTPSFMYWKDMLP